MTKEARICNGKKIASSITGETTQKRIKSEHSLTPYTKVNSKWTEVLNRKPDTIKLLEESIAEYSLT